MVETKALITATLDAGLEFFRAPHGELSEAQKAGVLVERRARPPVLVPIRSLAESHRERIAQHLLALDGQDRYLRFGYAAQEAQIRAYTDKLDFERDEIYGIYNRKLELIAMAHLAFASNAECKSCAEFGCSVLKGVRGRGYGARLFDRAVMHARNEGVDLMFIHALSENTAMLNIARKAGALVERDGSESEAYLKLTEATIDSRVTEMVETQMAEVDFQLKLQAKRFWEFLADVQSIREGVRLGRHKSAE